jgi:hypothetical protein
MKISFFLWGAIILGVIACESENEKIVQAELANVQASWMIQSFDINGVVPDSLKNVLKTGEFLLEKCNYSKKARKSSVRNCTGDFFFNEEFYDGDYEYDINNKVFRISIYILTRFPETSSKTTPQQEKVKALISGDWILTTNGGNMTATQIKNNLFPDAKISFTAIKK